MKKFSISILASVIFFSLFLQLTIGYSQARMYSVLSPDMDSSSKGVKRIINTPIPGEFSVFLPLILTEKMNEGENQPPYQPSNPNPDNGAEISETNPVLFWTGGDPDGDPVTYDVYLDGGTGDPSTLVCDDISINSCEPGTLTEDVSYQWQVVAFDGELSTDGPIWHFKTQESFIPGEMVEIPAGEFEMGCDDEYNGGFPCESDELPIHTVYLDKYYIEKTEMTNGQYAQCVDAGACDLPWENSSSTWESYYDNPDFANYPVIWVTWEDAQDYCTWAGKRLPTSAEWEKAARGTSVIAYPWGDGDPNCSLANSYNGDTFNAVNPSYCIGDTNQVSSYPGGASHYGVLDMAGNVQEWVNDWNGDGFKVLRGGSWRSWWPYIRIASIESRPPTSAANYVGFRCASDAP